jgi:hypothetical protein
MKGVLVFRLPEEKTEFDNASHGQEYAVACFEFDQTLRSWAKHGHTFKNADEAIDGIRKLFSETLAEHGINWDWWNS